MKKLILLFFLLTLAGVPSAPAQYNAIVSSSTSKTVTLRCVGYGKKAKPAATDAELSAVRTVLFVGVHDTPFSMPLIQESQQSAEFRFDDFFNNFYNKDYKNFIESSIVVIPFGKNAVKTKCITVDVCVRVCALRKYLEDNNIIRKFGL